MKVAPGTDIIRASNQAEDIDEGKKQATYIMSPPTADRHGTLFLPSGWEARLDHFRANPVFIMSHNSWGGPEALLGSWVEVWIDKKRGLMGRAEYDLDHCALAREVWPMVEAGLIKAVSVGARIFGAVYWDEEAGIKELPPYARKMFKDEEIWAAFTDQELLECSQVLIGSNRQALKQAVARGLCTRSFALGISWEQDAEMRLVRPKNAPTQEAKEMERLSEGAAAGTQAACVATLNERVAPAEVSLLPAHLDTDDLILESSPAAEATPSETREGGPTTMAVDPKHYFRTINEVRAEGGNAPIPGGEAVILPPDTNLRAFEGSVLTVDEVAAERVIPPSLVASTAAAETDARTIAEIVRDTVKAEFAAFLAAGGGIQVPAVAEAAEARTYTDDDYEEASDALVDYAVSCGRDLDADERAAFLEAYLAAHATPTT